MTDITYRWMEANEVIKIADIDRAETIRVGYAYSVGELQRMEVVWDSPAWSSDDGEHSVAAQIRFCQDHLSRGARMYGAFDGERLAGIGIIQPEIDVETAQLAYLHVSNRYRRQGIGRRITDALIDEAKRGGAHKFYVSATPSGSAVGFYLSRGFFPTDAPIAALLELEPDDIHMIRDI